MPRAVDGLGADATLAGLMTGAQLMVLWACILIVIYLISGFVSIKVIGPRFRALGFSLIVESDDDRAVTACVQSAASSHGMRIERTRRNEAVCVRTGSVLKVDYNRFRYALRVIMRGKLVTVRVTDASPWWQPLIWGHLLALQRLRNERDDLDRFRSVIEIALGENWKIEPESLDLES